MRWSRAAVGARGMTVSQRKGYLETCRAPRRGGDGVVVADQLRADISSLARADVNTSSNDGAPGAAVATAVAELVVNIRNMAETEARAVESSLYRLRQTHPRQHPRGRPGSQREGDAIGVVATASCKLVVMGRPLQSLLMATGWMHLQ